MFTDFKISLEAARVNAKLTQKELAKKIGVGVTTILNWEQGKTEPTMSQLAAISEISGIPMDFISIPKRINLIDKEGE
jgi:transcriptional regulator with XRE-family HTH domain